MELSDAKAFIDLVTAESRRREALLDDVDPNYAYDKWMFTDLPFLHDLCLLFLVALRHHVERRLLYFAARATGHGNLLTSDEFQQRRNELNGLSPSKRWKTVEVRLKPEACANFGSIEALRLLANCYKHDPYKQPDAVLIAHLGLNAALTYASLPESGELQKGLALLVGLPEKSGYAEITQRFVNHAEAFLKDIQARNILSPHKGRRVSFVDFAH